MVHRDGIEPPTSGFSILFFIFLPCLFFIDKIKQNQGLQHFLGSAGIDWVFLHFGKFSYICRYIPWRCKRQTEAPQHG